MSGLRVPRPLFDAYMAYLRSDMTDALAKWESFRDLCHDHYLDPIDAGNLITCGGTLFV
jgi:hypothetical protein